MSFVTSMTSAFCGDCNRLRLMADGNLKVCRCRMSLCVINCFVSDHEHTHSDHSQKACALMVARLADQLLHCCILLHIGRLAGVRSSLHWLTPPHTGATPQ